MEGSQPEQTTGGAGAITTFTADGTETNDYSASRPLVTKPNRQPVGRVARRPALAGPRQQRAPRPNRASAAHHRSNDELVGCPFHDRVVASSLADLHLYQRDPRVHDRLRVS